MKRVKNFLAAAALGSVALSQSVAVQAAPVNARSGAIENQAEGMAGGMGGFAAGNGLWLVLLAVSAGLFVWAVTDDDNDDLPVSA